MTVRFLADENFDHRTLAGLLRRNPDVDIVSVVDAGLRTQDDRAVLEWAAHEGRILVTHDVSTMAGHAFERVAAGLPMPGSWRSRPARRGWSSSRRSCSSRPPATRGTGRTRSTTCRCAECRCTILLSRQRRGPWCGPTTSCALWGRRWSRRSARRQGPPVTWCGSTEPWRPDRLARPTMRWICSPGPLASSPPRIGCSRPSSCSCPRGPTRRSGAW